MTVTFEVTVIFYLLHKYSYVKYQVIVRVKVSPRRHATPDLRLTFARGLKQFHKLGTILSALGSTVYV